MEISIYFNRNLLNTSDLLWLLCEYCKLCGQLVQLRTLNYWVEIMSVVILICNYI